MDDSVTDINSTITELKPIFDKCSDQNSYSVLWFLVQQVTKLLSLRVLASSAHSDTESGLNTSLTSIVWLFDEISNKKIKPAPNNSRNCGGCMMSLTFLVLITLSDEAEKLSLLACWRRVHEILK